MRYRYDRRVPRIVGACLLTLFLVGCGGSGSGASRSNGPIVFVSYRAKGEKADIYRIDADGSGKRRLATATSSLAPVRPVVSPSGDLVAFAHEQKQELSPEVREALRKQHAPKSFYSTLSSTVRVAVVPLAGGKVRDTPAPTTGDVVTWSPDGDEIAFLGQDGLFGIRPSDNAIRVVLRGKDMAEPAWSPDVETIAFIRGSAVWLAEVDGGRTRQLTHPKFPLVDSSPTWSPDGKSVAYQEGDLLSLRKKATVKVVGDDGQGARVLVTLGLPQATAAAQPDWSPDGRLIAFYDSRGGTSGIFAVAAGGGNARFVVSGFSPSWAAAP